MIAFDIWIILPLLPLALPAGMGDHPTGGQP